MKEDQKAIYYLAGGNEETVRRSPLLQGYKKKGYEVLIMADDIDDIVVPSIGTFEELPLKAINKSGAVDDIEEKEEKEKKEKEGKDIIKRMKEALGDRVKDVVVSTRLVDSPVAVVVDDNDMSVQMQQILKQMGQGEVPDSKPILEINLDHPMVKKVVDSTDDEYVKSMSVILLDSALIHEGVMLKNPADFVNNLHQLLSK